MNITSSPTAAFMGAALVTGVEPIPRLNGDGIRVYLGARRKGIHVHMADPAQCDVVIATWCGTTGHLFATDVPPDALCVDCPEPTTTGGDPA